MILTLEILYSRHGLYCAVLSWLCCVTFFNFHMSCLEFIPLPSSPTLPNLTSLALSLSSLPLSDFTLSSLSSTTLPTIVSQQWFMPLLHCWLTAYSSWTVTQTPPSKSSPPNQGIYNPTLRLVLVGTTPRPFIIVKLLIMLIIV